jgi:hypothetical protein
MRPLLAIVAVFALAAAGCRTARMQVDPRVASSDAYVVSGADPRGPSSSIAFGPWTTWPVTGSNWSHRVLDVDEKSESYRSYAFRIDGPDGALDAECHEQRRESMTLRVITADERAAEGKPVLACAFRRAGAPDESAWTLGVSTRNDGGFAGELRAPGGAAAYAVRSSHAIEGTLVESGRPVGWTLEGDGGPAAAVETIGSGRVFLPHRVSEAPMFASAAAALLLFEPAH